MMKKKIINILKDPERAENSKYKYQMECFYMDLLDVVKVL